MTTRWLKFAVGYFRLFEGRLEFSTKLGGPAEPATAALFRARHTWTAEEMMEATKTYLSLAPEALA